MPCEVLFTESSPRVGGQELQLLQQAVALQAAGHGVALACRPDSAIAARAAELGLALLPLPLRNALDLRSLVGLRRFLARQRPRALVCHSGHDANLAVLAAHSLRQRPRLLRSRTYLAGRPSRWTHARLVDAVMVPSAFLRDQLLAEPGMDAARVSVVHPGIDFERLDVDALAPLPDELACWLAERRGPLVVQVGMLRGEKGHAVALEALARLRGQVDGLRYVAAGGGAMHDELSSRAVRLGLSAHVRFLELHPVAPLLRRADLVLMPSLYEPLGMAQIEALALGRPVLASRTGGIPETVDDGRTGRLLPPGDVAAWAQGIAAALADPATEQRLAAAGRADVRQRFSMARNLDALRRLAGLA